MAATLRTRALVILGLSALAIAQPLLDLFGKNPEFFVAGNYSSGQIVWFALLITFVPPLVLIGATSAATVINPRLGTIMFGVSIALLAAAFGLALARTLGLDQLAFAGIVGAALAAGVVVLALRSRPGRLFLSALAIANVFVLASFCFMSSTAELISGASMGDLGRVDVPAPQGPVVLIVLDELPAATLMRADGSLNDDRYPGFAALAESSTWFRNASSQYNLTHRAVPSILDGTLADADDLPTWGDHPRNLFSLLGEELPVHRYESVTDMCPPAACSPPPRRPLRQALEDASVVYGHRVLPETLRDGLPAIDNSWGEYGAQTATSDELVRQEAGAAGGDGASLVERAYAKWQALGAEERSPRGQAAILRQGIDDITATPALHVLHVALPHRPWVLSRTGIATSFEPELITDPDAPGYEFAARMEYQLHSMQVGAADALVGRLVEHLRSLPTWEDTLLVVTSDHGSNLTPPDIGRMKVTDANREEVYRVPLFIKAPGQTDGEIRDDSAQNLDVLPSVVDLLDADVDWEFDGHSLFDGSTAHTPPKVSPDVDAVVEIAAGRTRDFPHGDDWTALAAIGEHGDLVGTDVADHAVGEPSELHATLDQADLFDDLPTAAGTEPFVVAGEVHDTATEPPELVVALNGTIAGVVGGYRPDGTDWAFNGYVADFFESGSNEVALYEVTRDGSEATLHPVT
jgi:hypothetical protein